MKNVFGYDKSRGQVDDEFVIRRISEENSRRQDENYSKYKNIEKSASLPFWAKIEQYIFFCFALIVIISFVSAGFNIGFEQAYKNSKVILPIAACTGLISIILFVCEKIKYKKTESNPIVEQTALDQQKLNSACYEELKIPDGAEEIDVFFSIYKTTQKGKIKNANPLAKYVAIPIKIFTENNNLCFADTETVTAVPISSILCAYKTDKTVSFLNWNKPEAFNGDKYKQYKIKANTVAFYVKPYYSVRISRNGCEYEIVIPPYDFEIIKKYLNINVY